MALDPLSESLILAMLVLLALLALLMLVTMFLLVWLDPISEPISDPISEPISPDVPKLQFDPGEGETCSKIQRILESCHESEKKLQSLRAEVAGVQGNHLPQHLHSQAVTKQTRTGAGIQEQLVKLLEQLDALVLEQDQAEARARRKAAVQHIQATLDSADSLQQQLAELKQKVS
eukprot:scpid76471/ scgid3361/ BAG family molecular chaperone regulator 1; Bcl-2-associated athanogene 1